MAPWWPWACSSHFELRCPGLGEGSCPPLPTALSQAAPWGHVCHCSVSPGCQTALWGVPGQPVLRAHLYHQRVRDEPTASRVYRGPLLSHTAPVWPHGGGGGDPRARVPAAGWHTWGGSAAFPFCVQMLALWPWEPGSQESVTGSREGPRPCTWVRAARQVGCCSHFVGLWGPPDGGLRSPSWR